MNSGTFPVIRMLLFLIIKNYNSSSKVGKDSLPLPGPEPKETAPAQRGAEYVSQEGGGRSGEPTTSWGGQCIKELSRPRAQSGA